MVSALVAVVITGGSSTATTVSEKLLVLVVMPSATVKKILLVPNKLVAGVINKERSTFVPLKTRLVARLIELLASLVLKAFTTRLVAGVSASLTVKGSVSGVS